ncbi:MAG: PEGA domain-containing protein [Myxococcota bacterium]
MLLLLAQAHAEDVFVSSNERGATILINGLDSGHTTPATVSGVKPGPTSITVEGGCSRGEAVVTVLPGTVTRANIVADELFGTLTLVPVPANARLELDNKPFIGAPGTPLALSCGDHTVRATLEGYITAVVTIDLDMGQDLTVPLSLQKLGIGTLELSVKPRTATLYVDGKPVGTDAVTLPSVYQGVHVISAELDGYQSAKKQVVVEDAGSQAFHFELARASGRLQSTVTRLGGTPAESETAAVATPEIAPAPESHAKREAEAARDADAAREADRKREADADREATAKREADAERAADTKREADADRVAEREAEAAREAERKADAEREAAAQRKADARKQADSDRKEDSKTARSGPPIGKTVAGISLLAAGAGAGVYGVIAYDSAARAYDAYVTKVKGAGIDKQRERLADEYYDDSVVPRRNLLYGSTIGAGVFLAGGIVVLVIDERLPILAPAPGGGMVLWSGRF